MTITIRPEPWSASDAHRIATQARRAAHWPRNAGRESFTFRWREFYVTVTRGVHECHTQAAS
jgi:hypothetical protein